MRRIIVGLLLVLASAGAAFFFLRPPTGTAADVAYRLAPVDRGTITATVRATGTLNPVTTILVGSQLSGQVVEILADYNSPVRAGQVLARLYSEQIKSRRDAARADLEQAKADIAVRRAQADKARATLERAQAATRDLEAQRDRARAQLAEAKRNLARQTELTERAVGTQNALDTARTQSEIMTAAVASAEAQILSNAAEISGLKADIAVADAQILAGEAVLLQREAKLKDIEIDLARTDIKSPVDGVVVKRDIELGQTVAASLSAPTLFTVAQDLSEIDIYANIDEADVGRLKAGQAVTFTVNAYPTRSFSGSLRMVRLSAQTVQNVVTYTAVIGVENQDQALLPGMTANLSIVTDDRRNVLRVPNAALRFRPTAGAATAAIPSAPPAIAVAFSEPQGRGGAWQAFRERLVEEVKPTAEQLQAIDAIVAEARTGARMAGLPETERRAAFRQARQEMQARIAAVLTPEQRQKLAALRTEGRRATAVPPDQGLPGRVYTLDASGRPQPVALRIGATDGSFTEIVTSDLAEGTPVIVGGGPKAAAPAGADGGSPAPRPRGPRLF